MKGLLLYDYNHPNSEKMQSAYNRGHSTEMVLLKIQNNVLQAIGKQNCVLLVFLDLSAPFDTVDHAILLNKMKARFGITGKVLNWHVQKSSSENKSSTKSQIL